TYPYTSQVLTDQARKDAANSVPDQYTSLDADIGRAQLNRARQFFNFVETVRADFQATPAKKIEYLRAVETITIDDAIASDLLALSEEEYAAVKLETLDIIDTVMRQEIREGQLRDAQREARRQASLNLTPAQENVVTSITPQFIVPTVFLDLETTQKQRQDAAAAVAPVTRTVYKGQQIVSAGTIINEAHVELLTGLGLLEESVEWQGIFSTFLASLLGSVLITLYWQQSSNDLAKNGRYLGALTLLILIFALIAKILPSGSTYMLYWYPMAALSMLIAVIFELNMAVLVTAVISALLAFAVANQSLEMGLYFAAGGLLSVLTLRDAQRINAFFRAGVMAAVGYMAVILMFRIPQDIAPFEVAQLMLFGLANGVLSAALTLAGFFVMGGLFRVTTTLQLQDLSRLDHPLLQELLRRAPGTYHHSIMVANLAEQAADRVKANGTLVRVGAFYHDIGKMNHPEYFTENQEGINPHDNLDPYESASIIIAHVPDGLALAKKYKLPDRIQDFIAEHHGERLVWGFYRKELSLTNDDESQIDVEKFRYPGPRPRCRESGIVMLADAVEATSSALRPNTGKAIEKLVNKIIDDDVMQGQLNNTGLTMRDIQLVRESFIETLKGRFHVRVKYPGNEQIEEGNEAEQKPAQLPEPVPNMLLTSPIEEPEPSPVINQDSK
ncbi:MAG: HDIG domain-containing protein, partial [Anaerolineae bacterium]|nr:HDIG domain-containing protein [Anaerolineae bacterium]